MRPFQQRRIRFFLHPEEHRVSKVACRPRPARTIRGCQYDAGTKDTLAIKQVRKYDWRVGSRVECLWAGGTDWYPGKISQMGKDGSSISILYDDGGCENTTTGACRSS